MHTTNPRSRKWRWLGAAGAAFVPALAFAALEVPHEFAAGDPIVAAEMNENFDAVQTEVNALEATLVEQQTELSGHDAAIAANASSASTNAGAIALNASDIDELDGRVTALEGGLQIMAHQVTVTTTLDWTTQTTVVFLDLPGAHVLGGSIDGIPQGARATLSLGHAVFGLGPHSDPIPYHEPIDEFFEEPGVSIVANTPYVIVDASRNGGSATVTFDLTVYYVQ